MVRMQAIGNLGKDAVTNTVNGKTVINFTVAHTEKGRDRDAQGNPKDKTIWVDCAYWTERTAVAQYLKRERRYMWKDSRISEPIQHRMVARVHHLHCV